MIHRDVKPENVLYSQEGVAKLCDFGFARPCVVINGERFTDYVATRWYRAPELLVKESVYESSVDIWAVGCLLPEMLSGDALFPGESDMDQLHLVIAVRGYLPKGMIETFYKTPEFYSKRIPEPRHESIEQHCPELINLKV
jgi:cyclin-dependent kinase-like